MLRRFRNWTLTSLAVLLTAAGVTGAALPEADATTATIDGSTTYQPIDGFGISEHFGRAAIMNGSQGLSAQHQKEILDLLFNRSTGAGLSILRLGIDSGIQPTDPGGPNATPKYTWDGYDKGQVWLAKQAKAYGVNRFYADAWTAPGYMKTNGTDANGGTLCGLSGATCASGDWRKAYANFLVQYARFYGQEGIGITDLGFTNEPDWTATYDSMRLTPAQAVEFTKVLGPVARAAGYKVACCDSFGWTQQKAYSSAIEADATARGYVTTHTGHTYASAVDGPLPTTQRTWMSEWSPNGTTWNENWDDGSGYDGLTVASAIHDALTKGNTSGYVYWYGASTGATRGLIQMDGDSYHVSMRLWALAGYSRFIRPGATRIGATTGDSNLKLSAFRNTDGTVTVVALNASSSATPVGFSLRNTGITDGTATGYLTDGTHAMAQQSPLAVSGGTLNATLPARSLMTYTLKKSPPAKAALPSSFQWTSSGVLISPKPDATHNLTAIKDPSVVYHNGKYHVYGSTTNASGSYSLVYTSFSDWSQASSSPQYFLDQNPNIGTGYRAAPQVFYFAPRKKWYLVYQTGSGGSYSTADDPGKPSTWSAPKNFYSAMPDIIKQNIGNGYWVDFWTICDSAKCYLFSSDDNGHLYRSETTVANFPNGFGDTRIVLQDTSDKYRLWEASNVYKLAGSNSYLLLVEAIGSNGKRFFRSWTAPSLTSTWTALADTEANPFARSTNVTFTGTPWTQDISHGEMVRSGTDQTLTIDPCHLRYLYQGMDPAATGPYSTLPWRLGLLTQTNSSC